MSQESSSDEPASYPPSSPAPPQAGPSSPPIQSITYQMDHTKYSEDHWDWNNNLDEHERDLLISEDGKWSTERRQSSGGRAGVGTEAGLRSWVTTTSRRLVGSRKAGIVVVLLGMLWILQSSRSTREYWDNVVAGDELDEEPPIPVYEDEEPQVVPQDHHPLTGGGYGSKVTLENHETFTYRNTFGGQWNSTPLSNAAFAQIDVPPLSVPWNFSAQTIAGVNLGGWLVLEPFITPALFEPWEKATLPAVDEYTLSINLGPELASVLQAHYATFITEKDFAEIASAGLNWVRIPLPYWAIEVWEREPFLEKVAWEYFLKAVVWARKYGLRINLDLHTVPGSQNGWNHSGRLGDVNFMRGKMGIVNAQRTLNYIRTLSEFCSRPDIAPVIPMLSVANEALADVIGIENLKAFYYQSYKTVRNVTGNRQGPLISFHDGFAGRDTWHGFLRGADRLALDSHLYLCFGEQNEDPLPLQAYKPCYKWARGFNRTMSRFGFSYAGEWSLAVNDCGTYLNNVGMGSRFDGSYPNASVPDPDHPPLGSCELWNDHTLWDEEMKEGLRAVALGQMDAFRNWFFWTWKTGLTTQTNKVANPLWSYSLGLKEGYIPPIPRGFEGFCASQAQELNFAPPRTANWSGRVRAGNGKIVNSEVRLWSQFPPVALVDLGTLSLEEGGEPIVLSGPSISSLPVPASSNSHSAAAKSSAKSVWYAKVAGVQYSPAWMR